MQSLNICEAFDLESLLEGIKHADTYKSEISEEVGSLELSSFIIKSIHSKSDAWASVILTVSFVQLDQIGLIELVLEIDSEVDHKSIGRSSFDWASGGIVVVREFHGLDGGGIFNELVHKT